MEGAIRSLALETRSRDESLAEAIRKVDEESRSRDEAVTDRIVALEAGLQRVDQDSRSRDASLEMAIRELRVDVQENGVGIRELAGKVETLTRLEERVADLERRARSS